MRANQINQTRGLSAPSALAALMMPTTNWAQKRADMNANLQMQSQLTLMKQQEQQQLLQQRALIEAEYQKVLDLDLLQPDKERVNYMADAFEESIVKKVREKYNGNLKDYLNTEAALDQQKFAGMLKRSEAFQYGLKNKSNVSEYKEARNKGLLPRTINGLTFEQQYDKFRKGEIKTLEYNGAFKPSTNFSKAITSSYGEDRFKKQAATPDEILQAMTLDGLTPEDAAEQYRQMGLGSMPIYHKYDDIYAKTKYELDINKGLAELRKANESTSSGMIDIPSAVFRDYNRTVAVPFKFDGKTQTQATMGIAKRMSVGITEQLMGSMGAYKPKDDQPFYTFDGGVSGRTLYGKEVPVKNFVPRDPVTMVDANGQEQYFIRGDVYLTEDEAQSESWGIEGGVFNPFAKNLIDGSKVTPQKDGFFKDLFQKSNTYKVEDVLVSFNGNAGTAAQSMVNKKVGLKASHVLANPLSSVVSYD